ncbi:MAG: hypothetical protein AAF512_22180, partial [Pseudomonadota bacterium]
MIKTNLTRILVLGLILSGCSTPPIEVKPEQEIYGETFNHVESSYDLHEHIENQQHAYLRDFWTHLLPPDWLPRVKEFRIFSDGRQGTYAFVLQDLDGQWIVGLDPADNLQNVRPARDVAETVTHEFGHMFSLDTSQMSFVRRLIEDEQLLENSPMLQKDIQRANGQVLFWWPQPEGVSMSPKESSVLGKYFRKFWLGQEIYADYLGLGETRAFANKWSQTLITPSWARSPNEDFAEAWRVFVLSELPENGMQQRKVAFFNEFTDIQKSPRGYALR